MFVNGYFLAVHLMTHAYYNPCMTWGALRARQPWHVRPKVNSSSRRFSYRGNPTLHTTTHNFLRYFSGLQTTDLGLPKSVLSGTRPKTPLGTRQNALLLIWRTQGFSDQEAELSGFIGYTRMIHTCFCCNRPSTATTGLRLAGGQHVEAAGPGRRAALHALSILQSRLDEQGKG